VHGKKPAEQESARPSLTTRTVEAPSAEPRIGRHRRQPAPGRRSAARTRIGPALRAAPVRLALVTGLTCCLGFVALTESRTAGTTPDRTVPIDAVSDRSAVAADQPASRGQVRVPVPATATPTATASPGPSRPTRPRPVAGLSRAQMDNAQIIVTVGQRLKVPRKGLIVAVATAMQESDLHNLASEVVPESLNYPHQGTGADHDSVGLFQQRPSSGWGTVRDLMRPAYAAEKFYRALLEIPGWQGLSLTAAAQAVQISAFPDAYAKHEPRATLIVAALT
jgi:hypothetical protein